MRFKQGRSCYRGADWPMKRLQRRLSTNDGSSTVRMCNLKLLGSTSPLRPCSVNYEAQKHLIQKGLQVFAKLNAGWKHNLRGHMARLTSRISTVSSTVRRIAMLTSSSRLLSRNKTVAGTALGFIIGSSRELWYLWGSLIRPLGTSQSQIRAFVLIQRKGLITGLLLPCRRRRVFVPDLTAIH